MAYFTWLGTDAENQPIEQVVETHLETFDENQHSLAVFYGITISTCKWPVSFLYCYSICIGNQKLEFDWSGIGLFNVNLNCISVMW